MITNEKTFHEILNEQKFATVEHCTAFRNRINKTRTVLKVTKSLNDKCKAIQTKTDFFMYKTINEKNKTKQRWYRSTSGNYLTKEKDRHKQNMEGLNISTSVPF